MPTINLPESISVRVPKANKDYTLDLSALTSETIVFLIQHGFKQKVGDAAAGPDKGVDDCDKVAARIAANEVSASRGGSRLTVEDRALREFAEARFRKVSPLGHPLKAADVKKLAMADDVWKHIAKSYGRDEETVRSHPKIQAELATIAERLRSMTVDVDLNLD